jgi:hypothetical protein
MDTGEGKLEKAKMVFDLNVNFLFLCVCLGMN